MGIGEGYPLSVVSTFAISIPASCAVPPSRAEGADPAKLARQISLFGRSAEGMPPPWVYEGTDGALVLYNGVTRATRIAKLSPGTLVRVKVIGRLPRAYYPGRKADHDPCRLARQVNEFCERAARMVNQRLDPCQLVWQVKESGSENGVSREDSFTCRTSRQGSSLASRVSHLANKTTSPAGQARRGRVSKLLAEVICLAAEDRRLAPMTSEIQREAMSVLAEVWALSPDVRLGQLVAHLGFLGEAHVGKGLGYIEDDEFLAVLYRHRAELLARGQDVPNQPLRPTGAATSVSGSSTLAQPAPVAEG